MLAMLIGKYIYIYILYPLIYGIYNLTDPNGTNDQKSLNHQIKPFSAF